MYPPQNDFITRNSDGSLTAIIRGHRIEIAKDGAIRALNGRTGEVEFAKPGGGK
jgi:hypothetical protein